MMSMYNRAIRSSLSMPRIFSSTCNVFFDQSNKVVQNRDVKKHVNANERLNAFICEKLGIP